MSVKKIVLRCLILTVIAWLCAFGAFYLGFLESLENVTYDDRMIRTSKYVRPSEDVCVVLLDQASLDWGYEEFGWSWPWPRSAYGDLVRFFDAGDAASVTFDVLFTEPSFYGADDDKNFQQACDDFGKVIQTVFFDREKGNTDGWPENAPTPLIEISPGVFDKVPVIPSEDKALFPISELAGSAAIMGNINSFPDADGVIRRATLGRQWNGSFIPTLGVASLFLEEQESDREVPYVLEPYSGEESQLLRFPRDGVEGYAPYSIAHILQSYYAYQNGKEGVLLPSDFENQHIIFGYFAPGLFDICATPVDSAFPGVGVHIVQLDNVLTSRFLHKTSLGVSALLLLFLGLLGVVPVTLAEMYPSKRHSLITSIVYFILSGVLYYVLSYVIFHAGVVVPVVPGLLALGIGFAFALIVGYRQEGRQRRYLKSAFKQYLSPVVIEDLIAHPERLRLGGERRRISIYFSDVQGFTSISENLDPASLTSLLNDYLSEMSDIILQSGGTIDKYEGDAIIAFWNAPVQQENHSVRALEAAVACQERLAELRPELEKRAGRPFYMRIGLNTGDAVVGNMGSRNRFDYTMLGDAVNLAARLEGLNKQFGTYCMCTEESKKEAERYGTVLAFRELGRAAVVGKSEAVTIFEPMSARVYEERQEIYKIFDTALQLFYQGDFVSAITEFEKIKDKDVAAVKYIEKCKVLQSTWSDMNTWKGVWVATEK